MKKRTLVLIILASLMVIYTGVSWYTGKIIANDFDQQVSQTDTLINQSQHFMTIKTTYSDYHQGLFSTKLKLKITATENNVLSSNQSQILFNDEITIYHGPFPWSQIRHLNFMPKMASLFYAMSEKTNPKLWQLTNKRPFLQARLSIDYQQNLNLDIHTLPINQANLANNTTYDISPGWLNLSVSHDRKQVNLQVDFDHLNIKNNVLNIDMSDLSMHGQPVSQPNSDWTYQMTAAINQLTLTEINRATQNPQSIKLNKISYSSQIQHDQTIGLHNQNSLNVEKIIFTNQLKSILLNNLTLTNQNVSTNNQTISGSLIGDIGHAQLDQQDLGTGHLKIAFENLPDSLLSRFSDASVNQTDEQKANDKIRINIDDVHWQNAQGMINLKLLTQLKNVNFNLAMQGEDNVEKLDFVFNAPFNTLAYILAQVANSDKPEVSQANIQDAYQSVILLSALLQNSSILQIEMTPNRQSSREAGIYSDLHYDNGQAQATMNGKPVDAQLFFSHLKLLK
ncbi:DUF945 family protein [Utexia brackfieldae]|uniref:DUF945 family protein n=1 Tax=Utexia brackfieldae TaxID=3074108 RepID=UPI00370D4BD4